MSAGQALRAAVEQRLMGVLEEVLGMIQSTVDQYESQLKQCRDREEASERLQGERALLLWPETTEQTREAEKEQNEMSIQTIIKEEEPDPWSISETQADLIKKDLPPPRTNLRRPHEQDPGNPAPNHKTKSEDSDEECPICRQLDLHQKEELTEQALTTETIIPNTRCNNENPQTSNQEERIEPQHFENMQVKSEENDQGYSDSAKKLTENVSEQERHGEEHAPQYFKITVTNEDQQIAPNSTNLCCLVPEETKEQNTETEKVVSSSLENHLGDGIDNSTVAEIEKEGPKENSGKLDTQNSNSAEGGLPINEEDITNTNSVDSTQKSVEQERMEEGECSQKGLKRSATDIDQEIAPKCKKISLEMQEETRESEKVLEKNLGGTMDNAMPDTKEPENLSKKTDNLDAQYTNSADKGLSMNEQNQEINDPKTQENILKDVSTTNTEDQVEWLTQNLVKKLPTVRLVPLKFVSETAQNEVQITKSIIRKPASTPQSILKENLVKQELCEIPSSNGSQQNGVQNSENSQTSTLHNTKILRKSVSFAEKKSEFVKSPSTRSISKQVSEKDKEKSSEISLRRQKSSKGQSRDRKAKQNDATVDSERASDTNNSNSKIRSDSGKSKEDRISKVKNLTAVQSGPVADQQGAKSSKLSSNIHTNNLNSVNTNKAVESPQKAGNNSQNLNDGKVSETRDSISSESKNKKRPKSTDKYECPECGTAFSLKGNLLKHLVVHREERPFSCSQCNATFKRKLNLKAHMSIHLEEKQYECSICHKKYTRKSNLDDHMKGHTGQKPYICSVCSRPFTCGSNLRRHMASHLGLRPFECEICGKKYGRKSILHEHMASHTRDRPFSCSVCKSKFSRQNNLRKHMRIHDLGRRYKCSECPSAFSQKVHLDQHMFQHTGDKPYKCPVCQKGFTRKAYIQQHKEMYCLGPASNQLSGFKPVRSPVRRHKQTQSPAQKETQSPADKPTQSSTQSHTLKQTQSPAHKPTQSSAQSQAHKQTQRPAHKPTQSSTQSPTHKQTPNPAHKQTQSPTRSHAHKQTQSSTHSHTHKQDRKAETQEGKMVE
ncbi:hypothetical protein NL108_006503 [Boleophthalmus pectinirostris]|uniref:zinc finger protein 510-like n=1 Tax=Boleophthalmus pectinirostris TaxID=150288 RepID=UPI00242D59E7|nr:zinc finger protein 510-like [Boleophthalmus pectinirostris]KAJ0055634.1 hypothetical protein NL108_006503 [Boleophthalmus pectinirostris]